MKPIENIAPIRIGGFWVKVEDCTEQLQYQQMVACWIGHKNVIGFSQAYGEDVQAQALLHEVGHAIEAIYLEGDGLSERQLSAFTQGLFQVLRDNRSLVEVITGWTFNEDALP